LSLPLAQLSPLLAGFAAVLSFLSYRVLFLRFRNRKAHDAAIRRLDG
jgi:hypothetical protein